MSAARKFEEYERELERGRVSVRIAGSGTYNGDVLRASGSTRVEGDLTLSEARVSGSFTCIGSIDASLTSFSGSTRITGDLVADAIRASGSLSVGGDLNARATARLSGSTAVSGTLGSGEVRVSGSLRAGRVRCSKLVASGSLRVEGDVECEYFELEAWGRCRIGGVLKSKSIHVRGGERRTIIRIGFIEISSVGRRKGVLEVKRIEGEEVDLEYTECEEVRGVRVRIGKGCIVRGNVYYVEHVEVDPSANIQGRVVTVEKL